MRSDGARPRWVRAMLSGTRSRGSATTGVWVSFAAAMAFALAGFFAPWIYLRLAFADAAEPDMAAGIGMALMPDLRLEGLVAASAMLLVAVASACARRWVDRHGRWH